MAHNVQFITLERRHLIEKITGGGRLTLLHAPAGYGKSIALDQWVESAGRDCEVVRLGVWEVPGDPVSLLGLLPAGPVTLILDDYQQLSTPARDEGIVRLLEEKPDLRIIIASRYFAALTGALTPTRVPVTIIGWKQLRFTPAESALLTDAYGVVAAERELGDAAEVAWPQGLQSRLLEMTGQAPGDMSTTRFALQSMELIQDRLQVEVFRAAAICPWIGPGTLTRFFELPEAKILAAIHGLESSGLLLVMAAPLQPRIAVHPALQDVAVREARLECVPARLRTLLREFAEQLALVSPPSAMSVLMEADDFAAADTLAPTAFGAQPGSPEHPGRLVRRLSLEQLRSLPILLQLRLMMDRFDPTVPLRLLPIEAQMLCDAARGELEAAPQHRPLVTQGNLLFALRSRGRWDLVEDYARDYQTRLTEYEASGAPRLAGTMSFGHSIVVLTALLTGDFKMAEESAQLASDLALISGYGIEQMRADGQIALVKALVGNPDEAAQHLEDELARAGAHLGSPVSPSRIDATLARLIVAYHARDPESVEGLLAEVTPTAHRLEQWPIFVVAEGALVRQLKGDYEAFLQMRRRIAEYPPELPSISPFWQESLRAQMANLATYTGRYRDAHDVLADSWNGGSGSWVAAHARLALFEGRTELTLELVEQGLLADHELRVKHDLLLLGAAAAFTRAESALAWDYLGRALPGFETISGKMSMSTLPYSLQQDMYEQWRQHSGDPSLSRFLEELPGKLRPEVFEPLSNAEVRTLRAMLDYETVNQAAEALFLSPNTVKSQLRAAYRKLGVSGRAEALVKAERLDILQGEDPQ